MILVADDDKTIRLSLKLILERNEYEVALTEGGDTDCPQYTRRRTGADGYELFTRY